MILSAPAQFLQLARLRKIADDELQVLGLFQSLVAAVA